MQKFASLPAPCYLCSITIISIGCATIIMGILLVALHMLGYVGIILILFGAAILTCGIAACVLMPQRHQFGWKRQPRSHRAVPGETSRPTSGQSLPSEGSSRHGETQVLIEQNGRSKSPNPASKIPCMICVKSKNKSGECRHQSGSSGASGASGSGAKNKHLVHVTNKAAYYKKGSAQNGSVASGSRLSQSEMTLLGACSSVTGSESNAEESTSAESTMMRSNLSDPMTRSQCESQPNLLRTYSNENMQADQLEPGANQNTNRLSYAESYPNILQAASDDALSELPPQQQPRSRSRGIDHSESQPNLQRPPRPQHPPGQHPGMRQIPTGACPHHARSSSVRAQPSSGGPIVVNGRAPGNYPYQCVACMKQHEARRQQMGFRYGEGPGAYPGPPSCTSCSHGSPGLSGRPGATNQAPPVVKPPLPGIIPQDNIPPMDERSLPSYDEAVYGHAANR